MAEAESAGPDLHQPFDASDPEAVNQKRRTAGRKKAEEKKVIEDLLSTRQGRAWYWQLLSDCNVFATSFSSDPLAMAFKEGWRNVGIRLLKEMPPDKLILAMKEAAHG